MIIKTTGEDQIDNDQVLKSDDPSQFICGVVEGFYGRPWTSEQRRKLFKRIGKMGMDCYIYAPKDDCKHRMFWREMYSVEEAEHLTHLIDAAHSNNVSFVYAVSPGLDMTYSSTKEVSFLKRKLEQVASFGCKSFAILFDDIDIDMSEADKAIYQSFAQAQVSVTNEVYQYLGQPAKFFFCPTEYCASRAVPNVANSEYLSTIGSKLLPAIDIMWTGPKVISKKISIKSIQEVASVLRRPPLIWDNIHANDYDPKRLFLGPYDGRSPELIPYLRGVLTNPNCEYEANFIALHTLAQWSKSNPQGLKRDCILSESAVVADIKLETDGEFIDDEDLPLNGALYTPRQALSLAVNDWMEEIFNKCGPVKVKMAVASVPAVTAPSVDCPDVCETKEDKEENSPLPSVSNLNQLSKLSQDSSAFIPASSCPVNSLLDPSSSESEAESGIESCSELMDYSVTCHNLSSTTNAPVTLADSMVVDESLLDNSTSTKLAVEDVYFLVDLFYLPFEHGSKACELLLEFHWLKVNAHCVSEVMQDSTEDDKVKAASEWQDRASHFRTTLGHVKAVLQRLCDIPNQAIVQDLYPYVWDMSNTACLVDTFISWLALGHVPYLVSVCFQQGSSPYTWGNKMYRDYFMNGDQEPWIFRGGLQAEFQRMLPFENAADLLVNACPARPQTRIMTVRPYSSQDKSAVYEICHQTYNWAGQQSDLTELCGDSLVGGFLALSPELCFVIEDEQGVCGYTACALDSRQHSKKLQDSYIPAMKLKYPNTNEPGPAQELTAAFHSDDSLNIPDTLYMQHPSMLRIDVLPDRLSGDPNAVRRALASSIATLKINGSHGVYTHVDCSHKQLVETYTKLGFYEMPATAKQTETGFLVRVI